MAQAGEKRGDRLTLPPGHNRAGTSSNSPAIATNSADQSRPFAAPKLHAVPLLPAEQPAAVVLPLCVFEWPVIALTRTCSGSSRRKSASGMGSRTSPRVPRARAEPRCILRASRADPFPPHRAPPRVLTVHWDCAVACVPLLRQLGSAIRVASATRGRGYRLERKGPHSSTD